MSKLLDLIIEQLKKIPFLQALSKISFITSTYHFLLAFFGALVYGFPSRKMIVIGVTGTKGKTTTCNLIAHILQSAGHRTGMATTVNFRIGEKEWINDTKQTALGRFRLQKLLKDMARAGCKYAVVETSSEGILQYRHRFIDYSVAVFTNITPEHIERHGSFEKYRAAKVKLFEWAAKNRNGIGIYNLDDPNVEYFLKPEIRNKFGFSLDGVPSRRFTEVKRLRMSNCKFKITGSRFEAEIDGIKIKFEMPLVGEFNVYNAAAAICVALSQDIPVQKIAEALRTAKPTPGRFEILQNKGITVVVDYAHEPASLEAVYKTVSLFKPKHVIGLLGSQGGGRDVWKRAAMGKIAAKYCDKIVLTNEDPYDEDPTRILSDIKSGISNFSAKGGSASGGQFPRLRVSFAEVATKAEQGYGGQAISNVFEIIDRREAIRKAISLAGSGDFVVLTGKGGEVWMCVENDKKIPWDEKKIVEEILSGK